jgi:formylglycine-generating enzyme required for sulfatase activity
MGSIRGEDKVASDHEIVRPPRTVVLSAFEIAATETTQQQYGKGGDLPIVNVTWTQARTFCQTRRGDLPTEAQWEYAARDGSRFPWSFGNDEAQLENYAWFGEGLLGQVHAVRQKRPNPLGLYDMHGNVWEWTRDWFGNYGSGVFVNPLGPSSGMFRVVRGGSFSAPPEGLRSAGRRRAHPEFRDEAFGFRCVRVPPQS